MITRPQQHWSKRATLLFGCLTAATCLVAEPGEGGPPAPGAPDPAGASVAAAPADAAATKFMTTCAGCHSVAGVKLTGPELSPVGAWPVDQLKQAIKRMEQKVGPLPDGEIAVLADLLRDTRVRERLKLEEGRIQAQFMAKMAPPDAGLGRRLFEGRAPLQHGGLACAACHVAGQQGGNLGPNLNGAHKKMGDTPLISAIEKASFKIMEPHYRRHPVTKQEALHLAKYLATLDPAQVAVAGVPMGTVGAGGALAALIGLVFYLREQRRERRRDTPLQRRKK